MTKAQIHFSNHLEALLPPLKENLFPLGAKPFDKRLVAVPHLGLKSYLMKAMAKDPDLQVAAGMQIVSLTQAFAKVTKKILPNCLELSLFLQHQILPLIENEPALKRYFKKESKEVRIGPFCDALAEIFLRYAIYGKNTLPSWQEKLWKSFEWTFPKACKTNWQIHLFGFSFIPESYFSFFEKAGAQMYIFSPCEIFWGDFYTEKEQAFLQKKVPETQLDIFEESFADQNPLLANWGKTGRRTHLMVEERNLICREYYVEREEKKSLHQIQNAFLQGTLPQMEADASLHGFSASSPLREIEILHDKILHLFDKEEIEPKDVQIFAPDISLYAPYIQAIFRDVAHSIGDLPLCEIDEMARSFARLIDLPKERFALEKVLQVFPQMKFDLDVGLCRKWLELANVHWGLSKEQRRAFYLQEMDEIAVNQEQGTWEMGLKRLLLGLGHTQGEEAPLCAIANTEMEEFDKLYTTIQSLADDLAPFYNGTLWTIPTWIRYFACLFESYFPIDPSHELYKQLLQLASACDHLDKEEVPYLGVERVLLQLLSRKTKGIGSSDLQAIQFASLSQGCVQPGKVICLIGLQEEIFPRKEEGLSLSFGQQSYRPTKTEEDRYLFLQALLSARAMFQMSYVRDESGKLGASLLIHELFSHLTNGEILHHPPQGYDARYFQKESISYSKEQYRIAMAKKNSPPKPPLIRDFFESISFESLVKQPMEVDVQKLCKFARHPLRYYLHEVLGIYPDFGRKEEGEFLLNSLTKSKLVREALENPIKQVLDDAKKRGELPLNLLKPLAIDQITKEVEEWKEAQEFFGATKRRKEKIDLQIGDFHLFGQLEFFTDQGLLVRGKNSLEDSIRFWPQGLIMEKYGLPLLPTKGKKPIFIEGSLEEYLEYFRLAHKHPSPLLPSFAKALLEGTAADLKKQLGRAEDETFAFLYFRDPMPNAEIVHRMWSGYLKNILGRVDAKV